MSELYNDDGTRKLKAVKHLLPHSARVITDPPYGNGKYDSDKEIPADFYRWMIDSFQTVAFFGYPEKLVSICAKIQAVPVEWITWNPLNKTAGRSNDYLPKEVECIAIFGDMPNPREMTRKRVKKGAAITAIHASRGNSNLTARLGDVWNDASPGMAFNSHLRQHPNEKPVSLMTKLVTLCSNKGDVVIDPFMGSGSTGVACMRLGRKFLGCEIKPEYYQTAEKRIEEAAQQMPMELGA
jgi:hypothetical protein